MEELVCARMFFLTGHWHTLQVLIGIVQLVWLYCLADQDGDGGRNTEIQRPITPLTERDHKTQTPRNPETQRLGDPG